MKRFYFLMMLIMSLSVSAQKIPFQGRLLDNGAPFNGVATLDFSITSPAWSETISNVTVQDGYYSVVLGNITPMPDDLFSDSPEITLNISVNSQALSPVTLYSPFLPYTGSNPVDIDSLYTQSVEVFGQSNVPKVVVQPTFNGGYEGIVLIRDSLDLSGAFLRTNNTLSTGYRNGYLQLNGRDQAGTLLSAVTTGAAIQGRANSFVDLYGGNSGDTGSQLLVDIYAADIDLNGPIPDGYRRGGIDIYNYYGNPTHNIFSEQIGIGTISHLNLNASQSGSGPEFTVNINSGDGFNSGGTMELRDTVSTTKVRLSGTSGQLDLFDSGGLIRISGESQTGRLNTFGPGGSLNASLRGRGDGDFGYIALFNNLNETRAELGSFGDNSGFMILYGANNNKNIQIDRNPANTDLGQISVFGTDGINARVFASADTDGSNEWGFVNIDGPTGGISLDGNSGSINASGNISANTLSSSDGTVQTSDKRLKKNIENLENPLAKTLQMRGVSYRWKDEAKSQRNQIGVIAQEVEAIYPEFIHTDEKGMKAVNYAQMTAVLIEAIKELNAKVESLENENSTLKASLSEVETLRKEMDQLMKILGSSKAASK